ncbi:DHA2 family efflux MFS transporter permease subunit [Pseudonocardia spinosispora]|uniref:DHA2 family efflux MFS transporter permease subunit n=1 Tax=Pseudonocardia spinosispora TaxID=103441 RepID=UPI0012EC922E|nr:DHA2 family efflux MFS transporter permease subunit [Pseudonocardia spinosispora]
MLPLIVLIVGTFMSVLDTSIVNVAVPDIQRQLGASADDVEWIVTGYTLVLGIIVPLTGWLGMRLGVTRLYMMSMIGFAATSALCGLAWDLPSLIIFRVLQAIPGGVLPVVAMTILFQIVPPQKVGVAMGMYGFGVVFAPGVGPTLGGYLVEYIHWSLIFYINVPIGIAGTAAAFAVFPRIPRPKTWPRFDVWGFLTIAYGLFAILLACSEGQNWGWTGYRVLGLFVTGVISLALFVVIELEVDNPVLDIRTLGNRAFLISLLMLIVTMIGLFITLFYIPQFLQVVQGLQALDTGLTMMPSALVMVVLMPMAGKIYDLIGPRWPAVIGLLIMAYGSFLLADLNPNTTREHIMLWTAIRNVGTGLCMMPIMTAGLAALPPALSSAGSGINNVMQRVSSSVAVAIFGGIGATSSAQMLNDRASILDTGAQALPQVAQAQENGTTGLMGMYQHLQLSVQAATYASAFYIVGFICLLGAALALLLRSGRAQKNPDAEPVHVEL